MTRYAPPTCCLRRLKDPSHSTTQHQKLDIRQIICNKYFKIISLMTLKCQETLRGWEKLVMILHHKTLRRLKVLCIHLSVCTSYLFGVCVITWKNRWVTVTNFNSIDALLEGLGKVRRWVTSVWVSIHPCLSLGGVCTKKKREKKEREREKEKDTITVFTA